MEISSIIPATNWVAVFKSKGDEESCIPLVCWALCSTMAPMTHKGQKIEIHGMVCSGADIVSAKSEKSFLRYELSINDFEIEQEFDLN
jgi:hypothetical protein